MVNIAFDHIFNHEPIEHTLSYFRLFGLDQLIVRDILRAVEQDLLEGINDNSVQIESLSLNKKPYKVFTLPDDGLLLLFSEKREM